jgi:hypothetical protein
MKIYLRKSLSSFIPADDEAAEVLKNYSQGTVVSCDIKRPRNYEHHKKLFALLNIVVDNQERFKSVAELLDAIKFELGYTETRETFDGWVRIPKSISFASMSQDEFNKFYSRSIDAILAHVLPGINRQDLESEVLSFG